MNTPLLQQRPDGVNNNDNTTDEEMQQQQQQHNQEDEELPSSSSSMFSKLFKNGDDDVTTITMDTSSSSNSSSAGSSDDNDGNTTTTNDDDDDENMGMTLPNEEEEQQVRPKRCRFFYSLVLAAFAALVLCRTIQVTTRRNNNNNNNTTTFTNKSSSPFDWLRDFFHFDFSTNNFSFIVDHHTTKNNNDSNDNNNNNSNHNHNHNTPPRISNGPTQIHLAYTNDPTVMLIQFTSADTGNHNNMGTHTPVALYGHDDLSHKIQGTTTTTTYTASDMCGEPATKRANFQSPGKLHTIQLTDLQPNTRYNYKVGLTYGQGIVWSEALSFTSAPVADTDDGDDQDYVYAVYGGGGGSSSSSTPNIPNNNNNNDGNAIKAVHILGNLANAKGDAQVWDDYMTSISTAFANRMPLMVVVGSNDYDYVRGDPTKDPSGDGSSAAGGIVDIDTTTTTTIVQDTQEAATTTKDKKKDSTLPYHPSWGDFEHELSGGECGVPMSKHFTMPTNNKDNDGDDDSNDDDSGNKKKRLISNGIFWYAYSIATVKTIVLSSEHDLSRGSPQYKFLEYQLSETRRRTTTTTTTTWTVVEIHRPLYNAARNHWNDNTIGIALRMELEDLLVDGGVDLVLSGHYDSYSRSCTGLYRSECHLDEDDEDGSSGPTHITIGSGSGRNGGSADTYSNDWTEKTIVGEVGYGRITANATDLLFEYVGTNGDGDGIKDEKVLDKVRLRKKKKNGNHATALKE